MTEAEQRQKESPLRTDRGVTTIKDTVVSKIAGMAAGDVEGVHMGGGASRAAAGFLGGAGSSQDQTRGVSAEVGRTEAAIDLTMAVDYGRDILQTVGRVRDRITARVESLTGLKITELNVTVSDVVFPEDGDSGKAAEDTTRSLTAGDDTTERRRTARTSPPSTRSDPLAEDQTTELKLDKEGDDERRER